MSHWDFPRTRASVDIMLTLAGEQGHSQADCLHGSTLTPEALRDPEIIIQARDELQVARRLQQLLGEDRCPGLATGARYHLSSYGIWGYALLSSPTLRSAITVGLRYIELTFAFCRIIAEPQGQDLRLVMDAGELPPDMRRFMLEREAAAIMTIQRELFAQAVPVRLASFSFPEAGRRAHYQALFGDELAFEAATTCAHIPAELLDQPLPQANPLTAAFCESQCRDLLSRHRARSGLSGQVRDLLLRHHGRMPAMAEVAASLCLSLRSLHRRLADEGSSFRALADEVREALAEELLAMRRLNTAQIAERLGYAESASFLHAFRRWKGMTPGQWLAAQPVSGTKFQHRR